MYSSEKHKVLWILATAQKALYVFGADTGQSLHFPLQGTQAPAREGGTSALNGP